jgi:hypothetical protein
MTFATLSTGFALLLNGLANEVVIANLTSITAGRLTRFRRAAFPWCAVAVIAKFTWLTVTGNLARLTRIYRFGWVIGSITISTATSGGEYT